MATTRLFRNGNSKAVRIPAELAYEPFGDELRIRPAGRRITRALEALATFSPSFKADGREQAEQQERSRRKARPAICPTCLAGVLKGPDADRAAIPATVDPLPVDRDARPGDYAIHDGELHHLDQVRPGMTVWQRHRCPA